MITLEEETTLSLIVPWNAAHLPIIYRMTSNLFPVNTLDDSDAFSTVIDDAGYAKIIYPVSYNVYEPGLYVKVSGGVYDGVYLIRSVDSGSVTLDTPFTLTDTGTFVKHYNNYHVRVKVYVGVPAGHPLYAHNPIAYRGIEYIVPNLDGQINFDASTWARSQLSINSNAAFADASVNEPDAWTGFYIAYAESYDVISGGETATYVGGYTEDPNVYFAVNAKLPMQNIRGGNMRKYVFNPADVPGDFLTNTQELVHFVGTRSYLSAIIDQADLFDFSIALQVEQFDNAGVLLATGSIPIPSNGDGVYRIPIHAIEGELLPTSSYLIAQLSYSGILCSVPKTIYLDRTCSRYDYPVRWLNNLGGWESFVFKGWKDYEIKTDRSFTTMDNHVDWPTEFINGDTETDLYNISAVSYTTIRSLKSTRSIVDWVKEMFYSIKVYKILSDRAKTILVDGRSLKLYRDRDRMYELEIDIRETDTLPIQAQ
jgi:hypothetical protein